MLAIILISLIFLFKLFLFFLIYDYCIYSLTHRQLKKNKKFCLKTKTKMKVRWLKINDLKNAPKKIKIVESFGVFSFISIFDL